MESIDPFREPDSVEAQAEQSHETSERAEPAEQQPQQQEASTSNASNTEEAPARPPQPTPAAQSPTSIRGPRDQPLRLRDNLDKSKILVCRAPSSPTIAECALA